MNTPNPKPQSPEALAEAVVAMLLRFAARNDPQKFKGYFMGAIVAIVANVLGNLPEHYWEQFIKAHPCNVPSCDCHRLASEVAPALEALRQDFKAHLPKSLSA
jgi:hypothetical protein